MAKLPSISGRKCVAALKKAGFYEDRQKGSHITMIRDIPFVRVTVPYNDPISPGTMRSIIRAAGMTVEQFVELL